MPELPEVETIRNQLANILPFEIRGASYSQVVDSVLKVRQFRPEQCTIVAVSRKGKLLNFHLENERHILGHLGMSGSWRISPEPLREKHAHIQFQGVSRNHPLCLSYVDPRRFGNVYFLQAPAAKRHLDQLGIDVLNPQFSGAYLRSLFKRFPKRQLKPFLLDQKHFSGIGNYLACEVCAVAGIRPTKRLARIPRSQIHKLHQAILKVVRGQIQSQGLTFSAGYKDAFGQDGGGVQNLVVFHQKNCGMCRSPVKKIVLAQRGTFYCPECQQ